MKIKLDENLPNVLAFLLTNLGHNVETVPEENLAGAQDADIWEAAQREGRFLITQDLDFSDIRRFIPGTHSGILLVRLQNPTWWALAERLESVFQGENVNSWERCLVVVTERKVRVREPR